MSLLTAVMFVFELTGIGFIPIPPLTVVIMMVPVMIGAVRHGKGAGAFLGFVFGVTSMMQCFNGKVPLGTFIFSISPFLTIVLNVGVRVLVGFLTGLIYQLIKNLDKNKTWSYAVAGMSGSLMNTVFYMTTLVVFFGSLSETQGAFGISGLSKTAFLLAAFGAVAFQAAAEAVVCTFIGGTVAKVADRFVKYS
jgi:uncharacterized membrane protein